MTPLRKELEARQKKILKTSSDITSETAERTNSVVSTASIPSRSQRTSKYGSKKSPHLSLCLDAKSSTSKYSSTKSSQVLLKS